MTDKSDNVKKYLKDVLGYFVQIQNHYYTEHARLQELSTKFDTFWKIVTGALQISDPSILRRGREGDISAEEMQAIIEEAIQENRNATIGYSTDNLIDVLRKEFQHRMNDDTPLADGDKLATIKTNLQKDHDKTEKEQLRQMQLMDNAIAFNKIFSAIKNPVVQLFTVK